MLDIDMQHIASVSKDRTSLFDGEYFKITKETGIRLLEWLDSGAEAPTLDENAVADFIATIKDCNSSESLKAAFTAAYTAAKNINDQEAISKFTSVKDIRKEEIAEMETQ
jgi:hypothetical protein